MTLALSDLITVEMLRRLAGPRSFERGEEYMLVGAVGALDIARASVRAGVQGTDRYRVRLEANREGLHGHCSCPVGREGGFCKHCVAVGLAWRSRERDSESSEPSSSDLEGRLTSLGAEVLSDLLVECASQDDRLHARLLAMTANVERAPGPALGQLKHAFDLAIERGGFVAWDETYRFVQGLEDVIDECGRQLGPGDGAAMVAFCEHALRKVESSFEYVDDSNGELGGLKERLEELHHEACVQARPDPAELAERLFGWELASESETFLGAVERYADVLGEVGLARYRELAYAAWAAEPAVGADEQFARDARRYSLSGIVERLARRQGDVDAVVAVMARDRSSGYRYLLIAEELLAAARVDEAIDWAERGRAAFNHRPDSRLIDFLCDRYDELGRHDDSVRLAWETLEAASNLESYKRLSNVASRASSWGSWRDRAREALRRQAATALGTPRDRSELVAALLWDDDLDEAWREAREGGCRRRLLVTLARRRESDHPLDALTVYRAQIEPAISHGDNHTYAGAIDWLEKIHALLLRLEQKETFEVLIDDLRNRHRAKRNLIKKLDEHGWVCTAGESARG